MTPIFVLTRAIHIGACLVLFAIFALDRFVAADARTVESSSRWPMRVREFTLVLLPVIFISAIAWFVLVSATMSGQWPQFEILKTVWTIRLLLWLIVVVIAAFAFSKPSRVIQKPAAWLQLILAGCLLGSLAWAGHGQEDSPWHLFADILHLLAAGFWPAGLLPFALLLKELHQSSSPTKWASMTALVRAFSALSLGCVAMLAATGMVNAWFLVGSVSNLLHQPYGQWLVLKIILFVAAVAIGAMNLLRLKPRLAAESSQSKSADALVVQLQRNVLLEIFLGTAIVLVVAILGILPP